jgi:hypothetical protein
LTSPRCGPDEGAVLSFSGVGVIGMLSLGAAGLQSETSHVRTEVGAGPATNAIFAVGEVEARWTATHLFAFELTIPWMYFDSADNPMFQPLGGPDAAQLANPTFAALGRTVLGVKQRGRLESGVGFAVGVTPIDRFLQVGGAAALDGYESFYRFATGHAALFIPLRIESRAESGFLFESETQAIAYLPAGNGSPGAGISTAFDFGYGKGLLEGTVGLGATLNYFFTTGLDYGTLFIEPKVRAWTSPPIGGDNRFWLQMRVRFVPALTSSGQNYGIDYGAFLGLGFAFDARLDRKAAGHSEDRSGG